MENTTTNDWVDQAYSWWKAVQANPRQRAELTRAHQLNEIYLTAAFAQLRRTLDNWSERDAAGLALMAGVLARVRDDSGPDSLGKALAGKGKSGARARLSGLRFRRLLQADDPEEAYQHLRRAVAMLDRKANVRDLARACLDWPHVYRGPTLRKQLAMDYYAAAPSED